MLWFFVFSGLFLIINAVFSLIDTITWRNATAPDIIGYGIHYAQVRHEHYEHELILGVIILLLGFAILTFSRFFIKRCKHCRKYIFKYKNFCHNCGNKNT